MRKRVFLGGATGVVGRRLLPGLVGAGYDVVGTTRDAAKSDELQAAGAHPVILDALDRDAVMAAVAAARPDVVIHQLTALTGVKNFKRCDEEFAMTNRLRTEGLDHLLAAAVAAGARRFIAQSYTGWPNERTGGPVKTEDDPLDPNPTAASVKSLAAIRHLESAVTGTAGIEGVVLRYGMFYGPGTGISTGGDIVEMVRKRSFPIVGGGGGVWSFVHMDDVTGATVAAVERGAPGVYNIVDDEPAQVAEWLPYLAETLGAKRPMRLPAWLVRPMLGEHGVSMMTAIRGSSNAKAKRELGWSLSYPSWRQGFRTGLGRSAAGGKKTLVTSLILVVLLVACAPGVPAFGSRMTGLGSMYGLSLEIEQGDWYQLNTKDLTFEGQLGIPTEFSWEAGDLKLDLAIVVGLLRQ